MEETVPTKTRRNTKPKKRNPQDAWVGLVRPLRRRIGELETRCAALEAALLLKPRVQR